MSREGFAMVQVDPATGTVKATALLEKGSHPVTDPRLDAQCPLFGDAVEQGTLALTRRSAPPVLWVDESGTVRDVFHRAPWPLEADGAAPGVWSSEFASRPGTPDGKLHLALKRQLFSDREMVQAAWRLPEGSPDPLPGEEEACRAIHERTVAAASGGTAARKRTDRRQALIFTIDNDDSRDLDDALEIVRLQEGHFIVGIHIADVTEFVGAGTQRDRDAERRGTSHYFDDRVVNMLPRFLSSDLCSLLPDQDRLAVSLYLELDTRGGKAQIMGSRIMTTVIRSRSRLTYSDANRALAGEAMDIPPDIREALGHAVNIGRALRAARPESLSEGNDHGMSGAMIEDFMVAANQQVGELLARMLGTLNGSRRYCLFRSQQPPSVQNLLIFSEHLQQVGLMPATDPEELLATAQARRDREFPRRSAKENEDFLASALHREIRARLRPGDPEAVRRCQALENDPALGLRRGARFAPFPEFSAHHSLGISRYAWFTSPIRRYPDMANHRFLKWSLTKGQPPVVVDHQAMHRRLADSRSAGHAYRQRRDFALFLGTQWKNRDRIEGVLVNFAWLSPSSFLIKVQADSTAVSIFLRDPEHARITRCGLECILLVPGERERTLRIRETVRLRVLPGDVSPQACCLLVQSDQWSAATEVRNGNNRN